MLSKINETLHVLLFPIKDMTFYNYIDLLATPICDLKMHSNNELKEKLRANLVLKCDANSYDEVDMLFHKFYKCKEKYSILKQSIDNIFKISKSLVSVRDGQITLKHWSSNNDVDLFGPYAETEKAAIYNTLNHVVASGIFVAAHFIENGITDSDQLDGIYQNINLTDAPLDDVLARGVSENHVHASAAFNFEALWQILMNGKQRGDYLKNLKVNCYVNHKFCDHKEQYILTAKIIRLVLAQYLYNFYITDSKKCPVCDWINEYFKSDPDHKNELLNLLFGCNEKDLLSKADCCEIIEIIERHFGLVDPNLKEDILFLIFKTNIKTYGENIFLLYAFRYMKETSISSEALNSFYNLFFKYLMIKNEFYNQIVQAYDVKGLDYFQEYFHRATGPLYNGLDSYKLYLRTMFQDQYLKQIELRLSFPSNLESLQKQIGDLLQSYLDVIQNDYFYDGNKSDTPNMDFPKLGIVFHLIKAQDSNGNEKCWQAFDNSNRTKHYLKYEELQDKYSNQVKKLAELRSTIPHLADFVVGLDAASLENNTPVSVFAPVFEEARDSKSDGRILIDAEGNKARIKSLFFTFHAGEDFRHVNSGLRRMDELLEFCKFHSGDRIGHGIALGVDIAEWTKSNPIVILPRSEYLDNLLWIWGVYANSETLNQMNCIYIEHKILEIAKQIFGSLTGIKINELYSCYKKRFEKFDSKKMLDFCNSENCTAVKENDVFCLNVKEEERKFWNEDKLLLAYHCKCYLKKMDEPIFVRTDNQEKEIAVDMQKYLIHRLSAKGIVVEVNPTSNAQISNLNNTINNQIFNINRYNDLNCDNVLTCINSDDPIVFNTTVSNEMAYLYYDLLNKGNGKEAALQWIEKIRKTGMETSFIYSNLNIQEYYRRLKQVVKQLNPDI